MTFIIELLVRLPLWQLALLIIAGLAIMAAAVAYAVSVLRELAIQSRKGCIALAAILARAGSASVCAAITGARFFSFVLWTGLLVTAGPPCRALARNCRKVGKLLLMLNHYARSGYREFKSFAEYRAAMKDEEGDEPPHKAGPSIDDLPAYDRALAILGLTRDEAASMPAVRKRYREIQSVVHPDKGMPSRWFSQMVNEAMEIVRKEHGVA